MDYSETKKVSEYIKSSVDLSIHYTSIEIDEEDDVNKIIYILEKNNKNIAIRTAALKDEKVAGDFLFLTSKMKSLLEETDLFIVLSSLVKKDDEELALKLRDFSFRHKTFVVHLTIEKS
ncbi:hypothetical protein ACSSUQ_004215 [Yersinia enterocolitica]